MSKYGFKWVPRSFNAWRRDRRRFIGYVLRGIPLQEWKEEQVMPVYSHYQEHDITNDSTDYAKDDSVMLEAESLLIVGMQQLSIDCGSNLGDKSKQQCKMDDLEEKELVEQSEEPENPNFDVSHDKKLLKIINDAKFELNHGNINRIGEDTEKLVSCASGDEEPESNATPSTNVQ